MSSVDVVVPCYNYAGFLPRCVNSLLNQPGVDVRVLVIDDASSDNTPAVAEEITARDSRVEYIRHATNKGHIATYNEGLLGWAKADYCLLISADDMVAEGAFARAAALMDRHPEVALTYGMTSIILDDAGPSAPLGVQPTEYQLVPSQPFLKYCCDIGNPVPTPAAIVRTRVQQELGGYLPQFPHTADYELWMRFGLHGPVGILKAVQAYYRIHRKNMSAEYYAAPISDRREKLQACEGVLKDYESRLPELRGYVATMAERLAEEAFWAGSHAFDAGNLDATRACLKFAAEANPRLPATPMWRKLQLKMALGSGWRVIQPLTDRLRGIQRATGQAPYAHKPPGHGELIGWWPPSPGNSATPLSLAS